MSCLVAADGRRLGRGAYEWWLEGGWRMVEVAVEGRLKMGWRTVTSAAN